MPYLILGASLGRDGPAAAAGSASCPARHVRQQRLWGLRPVGWGRTAVCCCRTAVRWHWAAVWWLPAAGARWVGGFEKGLQLHDIVLVRCSYVCDVRTHTYCFVSTVAWFVCLYSLLEVAIRVRMCQFIGRELVHLCDVFTNSQYVSESWTAHVR